MAYEYIDFNERLLVNNILSKYGIFGEIIEKSKKSFKIKTNDNIFILKSLTGNRSYISSIAELSNRLSINYFPKYISTLEGYLFVKYKKDFFYLTHLTYCSTDNVDFKSINDLIGASKLMATIHNDMVFKSLDGFKLKDKIENWPKVFLEAVENLNLFKKNYSKRKLNSKFDDLYMDNINKYLNYANLASDFINDSDFYKIIKVYREKNVLSIYKFNHKTIEKFNDIYYLSDIDSLCLDIPINTFSRFLRNTLCKSEFNWQFSSIKPIIDGYNSINKLTKNELQVILSLIIFPYKFYELGQKRYILGKALTDEEYLEKLNDFIKRNYVYDDFIQDFLTFLQLYE